MYKDIRFIHLQLDLDEDSHDLANLDGFRTHDGSMGLVYLPTVTITYHKNQPNVGKYTSPMDPMGYGRGTKHPLLLEASFFFPRPFEPSDHGGRMVFWCLK